MNRGISTKMMVVITTALTVVLLLGSLFLQRWAFKADTASASLFLNPSEFNVQPGTDVRLELTAEFDHQAYLTGAQIALTYSAELLSYKSFENALGWSVIKTTNNGGNVTLVTVPQQITKEVTNRVNLGVFVFKPLQAGLVKLQFDKNQTLLAAIDFGNGSAIYNALESIQDGIGTIAQNITEPTDFSVLTSKYSEAEQKSSTYTNQRFTSTEVITYPTTALIMVNLEYLGRLTVNFGPSDSLGQSVHLTNIGINHTVKLNGLTPGSVQYYQLVAENPLNGEKLIEAIQSFITPRFSSLPVDPANSTMVAFPNPTKDQVNMYILLRDKDNSIISGLAPNLTVISGQANISQVTEVDGQYAATVSSLASTKQAIVLKATLEGNEIATVKVTTDPTIVEKSAPVESPRTLLNLTGPNIGILIILLLGLVISGYGFWRLSRSK